MIDIDVLEMFIVGWYGRSESQARCATRFSAFLSGSAPAATLAEIRKAVEARLNGDVAASSVRSYLNLNPTKFERVGRGRYRLRS